MNECINVVFESFEQTWHAKINSDTGRNGGNKLRTYCTFKNEYNVEPYVANVIMSRKHRSAMAKFRCGVAPIKLETGRYTGTPVNERLCEFCDIGAIEDEFHVIVNCTKYDLLRQVAFNEIAGFNDKFTEMSQLEKFKYVLSNGDSARISAKLLCDSRY